MNQDKLFDSLDGLYAYDSGSTDSGIHDEKLREEIKEHLASMDEGTFRKVMSTFIRINFVSEEAISKGYGIEDVAGFINWLRDRMGIGI